MRRRGFRWPARGIVGWVLGLVLWGCEPAREGPAGEVPGDGADVSTPEDLPGEEAETPGPLPRSLPLDQWRIASSEAVGQDGASISQPGFDDASWLPARVPGTVAGAQEEEGLLGDPRFGRNLQDVPGWTWSFLPMPPDSPYGVGWWWRTEFDAPPREPDQRLWLVFEGINYRADVWVNGRLVASRDQVIGTFREHRLDVTDFLPSSGPCAVAVEVFAPDIFTDLAIYFVDWNPEPPDYSMGLWMPARVEVRGPVALRDPAVTTRLLPDGTAELTLVAGLSNAREVPQEVRVAGRFGGKAFEDTVSLGPGESREFAWTSDQIPALRVPDPVLWWPYAWGEPHLYRMDLEARVDGVLSDAVSFDFGIREVTSEVLPPNQRVYRINGRPILIRGAGWVPDLFHRHDPRRDRDEIAYVKDLGLNAIRLEGKLKDHAFYDLCDREGILVMPGWCCCDAWEDWDHWGDAQRTVARASLETQLRRLRRHPSVFTWLNGSDFHPPPDVEQMYLEVAREARWDLPVVSSATETPSTVTGPSGMKMTGPYHWVPPNYWYLAVPRDPMDLAGRVDWEWMYGGAFGFNSESSPGFSIPPLESLLRMMPEGDLWPPGETFLFHSGGLGSAPERLRVYLAGMSARLGAPDGAADLAQKAQVFQNEAHRAMFEAQGRNKYLATGHIQWMLNNAWPGLIWQLYDWFLRPGGTYYGARKALRPLHVQYAYDDRGVWVVNSTIRDVRDLQVEARLYALDGTRVVQRTTVIETLPADGKALALALGPDIDDQAPALAPVFFADLWLRDAAGAEVDRNTYWITIAEDACTWESTPDNLPKVQVADQSALASLPPVAIQRDPFTTTRQGEEVEVVQTLRNATAAIAFFVEVSLWDVGTGLPVLPILWDDNDRTLFPGETATWRGRVQADRVEGRSLEVRVTGWNVVP